MKLLYTLIFLFFSVDLLAQKLNGLVLDKETKTPVSGANVSTGLIKVTTSADGKFILNNLQRGDKLEVSRMGYETYNLTVGIRVADPTIIWLFQNSFALKQVDVTANRIHTIDSLRLRKEFASVFAYKKPSITNVFVSKVGYTPVPTFNSRYINSTSSLVTLSLLPLINLLSPKKDPTLKLQKKLNNKEVRDYIDEVFSKQKIVGLTRLEGDSLLTFMEKYRPTLLDAKKMTGYEVMIYIKKSYLEFSKP